MRRAGGLAKVRKIEKRRSAMSLEEQSLGEIASSIPGATRVFREYHMDFCCGGARSLREEAQRKKVDLAEVVDSLEQARAAPSADEDWKTVATEELVAYIVERFHQRHRRQFPELIHLAGKVEHVHARNPAAPSGLAAHLLEMQQDLLSHMAREEQMLFPMLVRGGPNTAGMVSVMEAEHLQQGEGLQEMLALAHQLKVPEDACNSWRALYRGLEELRDDLMEHIHIENNILFKRR
jgi:regulator of cell morphogenesis and NO signaling